MRNLDIAITGPFSLSSAREFACPCMVVSRSCPVDPDRLAIAFPSDADHAIVGASLQLRGSTLRASIVGGGDLESIRAQLVRSLSLAPDSRPFVEMVKHDRYLARFAGIAAAGFRPINFYSPYVFAGWAVLGQRIRMTQTAKLQVAIARAGGDVVTIDGNEVVSFPRPETILAFDSFAGISDEKWARLQGVARAALAGDLDPNVLAALPYDEAHRRLQAHRGIGPWSAHGILVRALGAPDHFYAEEPRIQAALGLDDKELIRASNKWRPFRNWAEVMVISQHERLAARAASGKHPNIAELVDDIRTSV